MRKIQVLGAAFFAVLAFGVVASAASAHEWVNLKKEKLTKVEKADTAGTLLLRTIGISSILGGGSVTFKCDGLFKGTVGLGAEDTVELATNLKSEEPDNVDCEAIESTNSVCTNGTLAHLKPDNLPWHTELIEEGGKIYDDFKKAGGEIGYGVLCGIIEGLCSTPLDRALFLENTVQGAKFQFLGELKAKCNIATEGKTFGGGTVLGFLVV